MKKKKIAVMASDGRMDIIAKELRTDGHEVWVCKSYDDMEVMEKRAGEWDVLLLPIRGIDKEGYSVVGEVRFCMETIMKNLRTDALVITGLQTEYLKKLDRKILCYFEDETVHLKNVALTAEGILYLMIKETKKSIFAQSVDIIGFGGVGKAAHRLLKTMNISHRIVDKVSKVAKEGECVMSLETWQKEMPAQIIINSVPAMIADEEIGKDWPESTTFLDIASGAVGASEQLKKKIHYIAAPPLPGLVAEESAGEMLADYVRGQI